MDDFIDFCQHRRSTRSFKPDLVSYELLVEMITAASFAPSLGDLQPWEFIIIREPEKRSAVVGMCEDKAWMQDAPALIAVIADEHRVQDYYGDGCETYCRDSCVAAIQNLLLAAHQRGVGSCWITRFDEEAVTDTLNIPATHSLVALIALGYSDEEELLQKDINPLRDFVFFDNYGNRKTDEAERLWDYGEALRNKANVAIDQVKRQAKYQQKKSAPTTAKFKDQLSEWVNRAKKR